MVRGMGAEALDLECSYLLFYKHFLSNVSPDRLHMVVQPATFEALSHVCFQ